jgi:outer membrane protein OmpA-like peptidoglycan-associated protein
MPKSTGPGRVELAPEYSSSNSMYAVLYNFDVDSDELKPAHTELLLKKAVPLLQSPYTHVLLIGSASRVGRENHNLRLSERRLNKVAEFLKSHGASEYQIQRKAVGESLAFGPNPDNEHHRAVTVIVVAKKNKVVVKVPSDEKSHD